MLLKMARLALIKVAHQMVARLSVRSSTEMQGFKLSRETWNSNLHLNSPATHKHVKGSEAFSVFLAKLEPYHILSGKESYANYQ